MLISRVEECETSCTYKETEKTKMSAGQKGMYEQRSLERRKNKRNSKDKLMENN